MLSQTISPSDVSSSTGCTLTPPGSPTIPPASSIISLTKTRSFFQKAREFIVTHLIYAWGDPDFLLGPTESQSLEGVNATNSIVVDDDEDTLTKSIATEESTEEPIKYKTFNEVWDPKAYKYTLEEILDKADKVNELDQYIFVVRRRVDKNAMDISFRIDIKSRYLRETLKSILKDVRGISLKEDKLCVEQNLLYHFLYDIQSYQNCSIGEERIKHVTLLSEYIETTYDDTTQRLLPLLRNGEITYDMLWALFKPNDIIYTRCFGTDKSRCFKFNFGVEKTSKSGTKYWNIEGWYLDFDGEGFGEVTIELQIMEFPGAKKINRLEAFPLQHHPNKEEVQTELLSCGKKFVSLKGTHHRHVRGTAFRIEKGTPVKVLVDSRIMVDAQFFKKINPNYSRPQVIECFDVWDFADDPGFVKISTAAKSDNIKRTHLSENDFLICCPTVPGFSFNDKLWVEFAVADIEEIDWSSLPFDCLTISDDQKEVIMALAENTSGNSQGSRFDDFVTGKGRGLNVLLHGSPGVGKTLTAEAVSEHLQRPLYSISAGELHIEAGKLEAQLSRIFKIASHWNAILLLDEADVYLEQRSSQNLVRNALVSVFLRKLEYCEGILFLTTNRVCEFDDAILSRIHVVFRYDDLSSNSRKQIWKHFLNKVDTTQGAVNVNEEQMKILADSKLNGRQIKNVMRTADALATRQKTNICFSHLKQAVKANEKFFKEFYRTENINSLFM